MGGAYRGSLALAVEAAQLDLERRHLLGFHLLLLRFWRRLGLLTGIGT